jgi:HK97 gp10 family phage protein
LGKATINMPEEFLLQISKLAEKTDTIIPKVLKAGAQPVLRKLKSNLAGVIGKGTKEESRSTGELAEALGVSSAGQDKDGNYNIKIGFKEPRTDGTSNAKLAKIIEYGKSGQAPKPFLANAKKAVKTECMEAMKAELQKEIEGI